MIIARTCHISYICIVGTTMCGGARSIPSPLRSSFRCFVHASFILSEQWAHAMRVCACTVVDGCCMPFRSSNDVHFMLFDDGCRTIETIDKVIVRRTLIDSVYESIFMISRIHVRRTLVHFNSRVNQIDVHICATLIRFSCAETQIVA